MWYKFYDAETLGETEFEGRVDHVVSRLKASILYACLSSSLSSPYLSYHTIRKLCHSTLLSLRVRPLSIASSLELSDTDGSIDGTTGPRGWPAGYGTGCHTSSGGCAASSHQESSCSFACGPNARADTSASASAGTSSGASSGARPGTRSGTRSCARPCDTKLFTEHEYGARAGSARGIGTTAHSDIWWWPRRRWKHGGDGHSDQRGATRDNSGER